MFIQGRKDFPPLLLGSVAGPKNYTDKRQINRRKAYTFYLMLTFLCVHNSLHIKKVKMKSSG